MSTIKVTNLQNASAASPAIVLDANSRATLNGLSYPTEGSLSGRNRIINGDMRIDQRNAGASVTPATGNYTLDRWFFGLDQASKLTTQQNAGSVTPPAGFTNYLGITSSSAYTVGASESFSIRQNIEGFNVSDLGFGTADAKSITLSFWVRSSLTGTFGGTLSNSAQNRVYVFSYAISAANTWEYKTVTIAGDTSGTWLADNGIGIRLSFSLGAGATVSGTAGSWGSTLYRSATGATSVVGTNGATFYITGVQLEAGSVATPFERRNYAQELMLCQRYYHTLGGESVYQIIGIGQCYSTTQFNGIAPTFPVPMRASPTFSYSSLTHWVAQNSTGSSIALSSLAQDATELSTKSGNLRGTVASGLAAGNASAIYANNTTSARVNWSAEL